MISARGVSGQLTFDGQTITITRRGFLPWLLTGSGGTKSISLKSVSAVQYRHCGLYQGYLQLSIAGELEGGGRGSGPQPFVSDENTLVFYPRANREFKVMHDTLQEAIREAASGVAPRQGNGQSAGRQPEPSTMEQVIAQIAQLAELRNSGALSQLEFDQKKALLLSRI